MSPLRSAWICALLGGVVLGGTGLVEALLLSRMVLYPDAPGEIGRTVAGYAGTGAGLGAALALAERAWLRRWPLHRASLLVGVLGALWLGASLLVLARGPLGLRLAQLTALATTFVLGAAGFGIALRAGRRRGPGRVRPRLLAPAAALLAFAALLPRLPPAPPAPGTSPSVLLVVMDTTRYDRLSVHGYAHETTPALDRIARESAVFTHAYASAPWTLPSHASIFTGRYVGEHGAHAEHTRLDPGVPTLAEGLAARGILPVAISRKAWLSSETGLFRGFGRVFDLHHPPRLPALREALLQARHALRRRPPDKGAREVTETAIAWLGRHGHEPFFLFVNYNEAHANLSPPSPFRERFLRELADTPWGRDRFPDMVANDLGRETYTVEEFEILGRLYDASVAYQDWRMGQLFDFLRERGLLDEILLVVTSDHGENLGEHGMLGHNLSMAETLLHVPLIVRHPRLVEAGLVSDAPVEIRRIGALVDLVLANAAGPRLGERELMAALSGRPDGAIFSEAYRPFIGRTGPEDIPDEPRYQRRRKSVVLDSLKYIWSSDGADELYELGSDPGEERNLASERPEERARLLRLLEAEPGLWWEPGSDPQVELSEEMKRQLREMGYLR